MKTKLPLTGDINVLVAAGTYNGQATYWDVNLSSTSWKVYIKSQTSTRPVFQGCSTVTCGCTTPGCATDIKAMQSSGTAHPDTSTYNRFLTVNLPAGSKSNLVIDNLQIKNYRNGIQLVGAGSNTIRNCSFFKIGDGWGPTSTGGVGHTILWDYGYAAIHTKNSDANTFGPDNAFSVNWNKDATCPGCVHGIYLAGGSSNNVITDSTFDTVSGDPIRLRGGIGAEGGSNGNLIQAGGGTLSFVRTGLPTADGAAVSLWQDTGECRSWTNDVNGARTDGTRTCGSLQAKFEYPSSGGTCSS